jgi:hypothetical protein
MCRVLCVLRVSCHVCGVLRTNLETVSGLSEIVLELGAQEEGRAGRSERHAHGGAALQRRRHLGRPDARVAPRDQLHAGALPRPPRHTSG